MYLSIALIVLLVILAFVFIFFLCRSIMLWYFKVSEVLNRIDKIEDDLDDIKASLKILIPPEKMNLLYSKEEQEAKKEAEAFENQEFYCTHCGTKLSMDDRFCPNCKAKNEMYGVSL